MIPNAKLFLYSLLVSGEQFVYLDALVGKSREAITFALIENAADVIEGSEEWVRGIRNSLQEQGYAVEPIDVRHWTNKREALREKLASKDVIWVCGGHTYYLRWILMETGADEIIKELVAEGKVYAGWSAGAIVAGPTTRYFDEMGDDPNDAPTTIFEGLCLSDIVVVPHGDNPEFSEGAQRARKRLDDEGFTTLLLSDSEVAIVDGEQLRIV